MPSEKGIFQKVDVIMRPELELAYLKAADQHFSHYTAGTPYHVTKGRLVFYNH